MVGSLVRVLRFRVVVLVFVLVLGVVLPVAAQDKPPLSSIDEAMSYAFGVLTLWGLGFAVTAGFLIVVGAVAGKALISFLRN